jgi:hypothetical protein
LPWSAAHVAYSLIRPKSQIPNIRHDGTLSIGNFMLIMKKLKNLGFEPVHPKNVLLASVVHGISCLLLFILIVVNEIAKSIFHASTPFCRDVEKRQQELH